MSKWQSAITGLFALMLAASDVLAGDFNEQNGVAIKGYDAVAYFTAKAPVKGVAEHNFVYKGSNFVFASKENRDAFAVEPEKYAPQYAGYCAYGVAAGGVKVDIDPNSFSVVDGKLYLNVNPAVQKRWSADVPGFIKTADEKWSEVSKLAPKR